MSGWDPARYLAFGNERLLPGLDLIAALGELDPEVVVDLGCGTGALTAALASRWPGAAITGVDRSAEMLGTARREHPDIRLVERDIADWEPDAPVDLIFSNAALHWLDDHARLLPRLTGFLSAHGRLAVQMPNNWDEPTHTVPAAILDTGDWPGEAVAALPRNRVAPAEFYEELLQGAHVWEVTYEHVLTGDDPVYEWASGSFLRPTLSVLSPRDRERFAEICSDAYRDAYPIRPDGTTVLPYRRLFVIGGPSPTSTSAPS